jgi:hypothetical protein
VFWRTIHARYAFYAAMVRISSLHLEGLFRDPEITISGGLVIAGGEG